MGVSGSAPATPTAPRNKHLAHLRDPRSPSAGILRTPIEVGVLLPLLPAGLGGYGPPPLRLLSPAGGELPGG